MIIKRIRAVNIGPIDNLDLALNGESIAFIGANASGKTFLLASIVDFVFEHLKGLGFDDVLPSAATGHRYYRLTSSRYRKDPLKPGLIWIEGRVNDRDLFYIEEYGVDNADAASKIIGTDVKNIPWPSKGYSKNINLLNDDDRLRAKKIVWNSPIFFLPATRFEDDSWKTGDFFVKDQSIDNPFSSNLGHSIEIFKSIQENVIWLTNEVFDALAFNNAEDEYLKTIAHLSNVRITLVVNLLSKMMGANGPLSIYFSPDRSDRLSLVDREGNVVLKSLSHLSLGQKAILNLVLNIFRLGNESLLPNEISGLVIIDEVDAHLTGEYRSSILPYVINLFPSVQFILSSHDPVSIVGLENNCSIKIIDLPSGDEVLAKDFKELEAVRRGLKALNSELSKIIENIKCARKPVLLVEDSYDQIYKVAWLKLHSVIFNENNIDDVFDKNASFDIIAANGFNNLYQFLNMHNTPSEIDNKKIIGLFDFDEAYNYFNGLNEDIWSKVKGTDSDGLYRRNTKYRLRSALVLPVPRHRINIASKEFGGNSHLCVELYFKNKILGENCARDGSFPGKIVKFAGNKAIFWKKCMKYDLDSFRPFRKLFDRIEILFKD